VNAYAAPAAGGVFLRDLHPVERPREKLARSGAEALSDQELLALALRTGYPGRSVMDLASGVLKDFPDLAAAGFAAGMARSKGSCCGDRRREATASRSRRARAVAAPR